MQKDQAESRNRFLKSLSNYSLCMKPYLRQVQDKYIAAYYVVESEPVNLKSYCTNEWKQTKNALAYHDNIIARTEYQATGLENDRKLSIFNVAFEKA